MNHLLSCKRKISNYC